MSIKEHNIPKTEELLNYFNRLDTTVSEILRQMNKFGTDQKVYILTGNVSQYKTDMLEVSKVLKKINKELLKDGVCIIHPVAEQAPITAIPDDNKRTGARKQDTNPKGRRRCVVPK